MIGFVREFIKNGETRKYEGRRLLYLSFVKPSLRFFPLNGFVAEYYFNFSKESAFIKSGHNLDFFNF